MSSVLDGANVVVLLIFNEETVVVDGLFAHKDWLILYVRTDRINITELCWTIFMPDCGSLIMSKIILFVLGLLLLGIYRTNQK